MPSTRMIWAGCLLMAFVGSACTGTSREANAWRYEIEEQDGLRTVRTLGGSVWGAPSRLELEASIGVADGSEEYVLGRVVGLYARAGLIYVLNQQPLTIRVYDYTGRFVRTVGRRGSGPGEYLGPAGIVVSPDDGTIYVRDAALSRMNLYSSEGEYIESWPLRTGSVSLHPPVLCTDGRLWTIARLPDRGTNRIRYQAMVQVTPGGIIADTLSVPAYDHEPWIIEFNSGQGLLATWVPFAPELVWAMSPSGAMVSGISDQTGFTVDRPDGSRTVIEWVREPVPFEPDEWRWYRNRTIASIRLSQPGWAWTGRAIPSRKPAFDALIPDRNGWIWVRRPGPGIRLEEGDPEPDTYAEYERHPCWAESFSLDVFEETGRYLGEVMLPEGFQTDPQPFIDADMIIALVRGSDDVPTVRRYRLVH